MNARTIARIAFAAIAVAGVANATSNPLDPAYYQGKPARIVATDSASKPYADIANPLAPSYRQGNPAVVFQAAAERRPTPYVDRNNPRDPSYRRN